MTTTLHRFGDLAEIGTAAIPGADGSSLYALDLSGLEIPELHAGLCGFDRHGRLLPWCFYAQSDFERTLAHRELGDPRAFARGRVVALPGPGRRCTAPDAAPSATADTEPEDTTPEENSLQTEQEASLSADPKVVDALTRFLGKPSLGSCPPDFKSVLQEVRTLLPDGREVPALVAADVCAHGVFSKVITFFPVRDVEFGPLLGRARICSTALEFDETQSATFRHVQKSTKLNLGLALGFSAKAGLQGTNPKVGEKAFGGGQPLLAENGEQVKFDFGLVRQHAKLKIEAHRRLFAKVTKFSCDPLDV